MPLASVLLTALACVALHSSAATSTSTATVLEIALAERLSFGVDTYAAFESTLQWVMVFGEAMNVFFRLFLPPVPSSLRSEVSKRSHVSFHFIPLFLQHSRQELLNPPNSL